LDNALENLSCGISEHDIVDVGLGSLAVRAPVLACGRVSCPSDVHNHKVLLLANLVQGLLEIGSVVDLYNLSHFILLLN
jgi:hypothetical protein